MEVKKDKQKFKGFNETYSLCAFGLAAAFLYPNKSNINKRVVLITVIIILNGGQIFWFMTYIFKCLYQLDLYNFARSMALLVIVILYFFKTFYVIFATNEFSAILQLISNDFVAANKLERDYQEFYEYYISLGKIAEKSWLMLPVGLAALLPIYAGVCMSIDSIETDDFKRMMVHDMDLMFVEDIQSEGPFFHCMFAYNCIQCVVLAPNFCGLDGSFCIATIHLRMKLKLMVHKVHKAFEESKCISELNCRLNEAIRDHQSAIKFYHQIQSLYGPWLFSLFLLTFAVISFNLYVMYLLQRFHLKYGAFCVFGVSLILLPCHYASTLTKISNEIPSDLYQAKWEKWLNPQITKKLMVMIHKSQETMHFTGAGIVIFNMELFKGVIQTSYSFFTLITTTKS